MNKIKLMAATLGLAVIVIGGVACANTPAPTPSASQQPTQPAPAIGAPAVAPGSPVIEPAQAPLIAIGAPAMEQTVRSNAVVGAPAPMGVPSYSYATSMQTSGAQSGIWVSGEGMISVEPDLAILNIGVETTGDTVAEANGDAADSMNSIVNALKDRGLEDRDIQTRSFNIFPMYEYNEVFVDGRRVGKQELVGFRVSNSASINIRDLDEIGEIIDEVAVAGGDSTRINGINFTVEDPKPFMDGLREAAVEDALAKAQQFAGLTGVSVGPMRFISETGGSSPVVLQDMSVKRGFAPEMAFAASAPTSISSGEMDFRLSIQAVFEIQ